MASCGAAYKNSFYVRDSIQNVELEMSKSEVVGIMGKTFVPVSSSKKDGKKIEVIGYESIHDPTGYLYLFYFIDDKLDHWQREWTGSTYIPYEQLKSEPSESTN